jgi:hypothetical protein
MIIYGIISATACIVFYKLGRITSAIECDRAVKRVHETIVNALHDTLTVDQLKKINNTLVRAIDSAIARDEEE